MDSVRETCCGVVFVSDLPGGRSDALLGESLSLDEGDSGDDVDNTDGGRANGGFIGALDRAVVMPTRGGEVTIFAEFAFVIDLYCEALIESFFSLSVVKHLVGYKRALNSVPGQVI